MSDTRILTETRPVSDFEYVVVHDVGNLVITQGDTESLTIEAEPELLPKISSDVHDQRLLLEIGHNWREKMTLNVAHLHRPPTYKLTVRDLHNLEISGSGHVSAEHLQTDRLKVRTSGSSHVELRDLHARTLTVDINGRGEFELDGTVDEQWVEIRGSGEYQAGSLESDFAEVVINGHAHAKVWADKDLLIYISGLGTIDYYGDPMVKEDVSGLSTVRSLGLHN